MRNPSRQEPKVMTLTEERRDYRPNWQRKCDNCGSVPTMRASGLCGPCHWGTADALAGGWWDQKADRFDEKFLDEHLPG